jgi:hypothetical protein
VHTIGSEGCEDIGVIVRDQLHIEATYDLDVVRATSGEKNDIMAVMFLYVGLGESVQERRNNVGLVVHRESCGGGAGE